jgi:hypothetical protein
MMSPAESETSCFFLPDHHGEEQQPFTEQEQLCYVHCNFCDTILVVPPIDFDSSMNLSFVLSSPN